VFEDVFVRMPLPMLQAIQVGTVGFDLVAGLEVGEVTLDVARCTTSSRCAETDVGRHSIYLETCVEKAALIANVCDDLWT